MEQVNTMLAILDSLTEEVVFVDTEHTIRYMNQAGINHYAARGAAIGKSIFSCHNQQSAIRIKDIFKQLQAGVEEVLFADNEKHRVYMRAVRDDTGKLLGYYERYAPPREFSGR